MRPQLKKETLHFCLSGWHYCYILQSGMGGNGEIERKFEEISEETIQNEVSLWGSPKINITLMYSKTSYYTSHRTYLAGKRHLFIDLSILAMIILVLQNMHIAETHIRRIFSSLQHLKVKTNNSFCHLSHSYMKQWVYLWKGYFGDD